MNSEMKKEWAIGRMPTSLHILVIEDDPQVGTLLQRVLEKGGHRTTLESGGLAAISRAREVHPDVILLDLDLEDISGMEVCRQLRQDPCLQFLPILLLTGQEKLDDKLRGFYLGADDYMTKPFRAWELLARLAVIHRRARQNLEANPLTHLPGNRPLKEEISKRVGRGNKLAILHCNIDRFKSYNDSYGFVRGDSVICDTALMILSCVDRSTEFVSHVGGDTFVVVTTTARCRNLAARIAAEFDKRAPAYYDPEEKESGLIENESKQREEHPLMTLSIAVIDNERHWFAHAGQFAQVAAQIRRRLKSRIDRTVSAFLGDIDARASTDQDRCVSGMQQ